MKIVTVVGVRPQLIKAAPVSRVLRDRHVDALNALDEPVILPVHPRTRQRMAAFGLQRAPAACG